MLVDTVLLPVLTRVNVLDTPTTPFRATSTSSKSHELEGSPFIIASHYIRYNNFDIQELKSHNSSNELISYLIFKKVCFDLYKVGFYQILIQEKRKGVGRPRLVEAPVKTKTCIYCRLCSAEGNLQEVLARKKEDPELFQLAKRLQWGDSMPVSLHKVENRKKIGTPWMKHNKHL